MSPLVEKVVGLRVKKRKNATFIWQFSFFCLPLQVVWQSMKEKQKLTNNF
jgi:hypothetical protein